MCSPYIKFPPEEKVQVARHAMESSNKRAIARHSSSGASISRKCSQDVEVEIRGSIANLTEALSIQNAAKYKMLPNCTQGRPLLFGKELDKSSHLPGKTQNF